MQAEPRWIPTRVVLSACLLVLSIALFHDRAVVSASRSYAYYSTLALSPLWYDGCICYECEHRAVGFTRIDYSVPRWATRGPRSTSGVVLGAMCGVIGLVVFLASKRALVIDADRCAHCDYDLAGLPSGRCPECGSLIGTP